MTDPWQWYVDNQIAIGESCRLSTVVAGAPDAAAFAQLGGSARERGVANAADYARALQQLRGIQTRAWALALAGGIPVNDPGYQWMMPAL